MLIALPETYNHEVRLNEICPSVCLFILSFYMSDGYIDISASDYSYGSTKRYESGTKPRSNSAQPSRGDATVNFVYYLFSLLFIMVYVSY